MDMSIFEKMHSKVCVSPVDTNPDVERLLDLMGVEFTPEPVKVKVEPYATERSCYFNIEDKVKRDGGKIHYGWAIWQSHYLCEAEHHAVWEDDNGDFLDITPREGKHETILFVPDNGKVFTGTSFPNVRINVSGNALIDDFILVLKVRDWMRIYGKAQGREMYGVPNPAGDFINVENGRPGTVAAIAHNMEVYYLSGNKPSSKCFCSSSKSYSDCHRKVNLLVLKNCVDKVVIALGKPNELVGQKVVKPL